MSESLKVKILEYLNSKGIFPQGNSIIERGDRPEYPFPDGSKRDILMFSFSVIVNNIPNIYYIGVYPGNEKLAFLLTPHYWEKISDE